MRRKADQDVIIYRIQNSLHFRMLHDHFNSKAFLCTVHGTSSATKIISGTTIGPCTQSPSSPNFRNVSTGSRPRRKIPLCMRRLLKHCETIMQIRCFGYSRVASARNDVAGWVLIHLEQAYRRLSIKNTVLISHCIRVLCAHDLMASKTLYLQDVYI